MSESGLPPSAGASSAGEGRAALARPARRLGGLGLSEPRRRILVAMIETVARRGYRRSTVSRVAAAAGVEEEIFHEHFHDRDDCFEEALDAILTEAELMVLHHFNGPLPWPQRMRSALRALLDAIDDYPDGAMAAVVESFAASETARERYRSTLRMLVLLVEEGRPLARHPESLAEQTSDAIVGGVASIVHRRVLEHNTAELPSLLDELTFFALMPWLGHEEALQVSGLDRAGGEQ